MVLTEAERMGAYTEALRRYTVNTANDVQGRNGAPAVGNEAFQMDLLGAAGEMAVAAHLHIKHLLYRETKPQRGSYDLPWFDVKTSSRDWGNLIVQLDGPREMNYVLVTIEKRQITIRGWAHSSEVMRPEYIADPKGGRRAYFFPQEKLRPMDTLDYGKSW